MACLRLAIGGAHASCPSLRATRQRARRPAAGQQLDGRHDEVGRAVPAWLLQAAPVWTPGYRRVIGRAPDADVRFVRVRAHAPGIVELVAGRIFLVNVSVVAALEWTGVLIAVFVNANLRAVGVLPLLIASVGASTSRGEVQVRGGGPQEMARTRPPLRGHVRLVSTISRRIMRAPRCRGRANASAPRTGPTRRRAEPRLRTEPLCRCTCRNPGRNERKTPSTPPRACTIRARGG